MDYLKVKDRSGLVRDANSQAIINIDNTAAERALENALKRKKEKQEIENLKNDVVEIKSMLKTLLSTLEKEN